MSISVFLAQILGPCFVVIGLGMLLNGKFYQKVMEDYVKNSALIFLGGMFALLFGLFIVLTHNIWVMSWVVIVTIYGWGAILKGIWLVGFPGSVSAVMRFYQNNDKLLLVHSLITLTIGALLSYFAYFTC